MRTDAVCTNHDGQDGGSSRPYYPRFGFVPGHTKGLTCDFPVPPDVFMAIELETGALTGASGLVRYHPQFGVE